MKKHKLYRTWQGIRNRCNNPNAIAYKNYGGRGIKICSRWDKFELFVADMGEKPTEQHTIDRIDNNGDYEPSNCRWITRKEQLKNTSRNVFHTYNGITKTQVEWSEIHKISDDVIRHRIKQGWSIKKIFETPARIVKRKPRRTKLLTN